MASRCLSEGMGQDMEIDALEKDWKRLKHRTGIVPVSITTTDLICDLAQDILAFQLSVYP